MQSTNIAHKSFFSRLIAELKGNGAPVTSVAVLAKKNERSLAHADVILSHLCGCRSRIAVGTAGPEMTMHIWEMNVFQNSKVCSCLLAI